MPPRIIIIKHDAGLVPREDVRIDEAELARRKISGQACERAREHEGAELVSEDRVADGAHALFVNPDAGQGAAERRVQQAIEEPKNQRSTSSARDNRTPLDFPNRAA